MGRIVSNFFISLDGVVERPDQWHFPYFDEAMGEIVGAGMSTSTAWLMGRTLYGEWSSYWPEQPPEEPFAEFINTIPKYVVSTTLQDASWNNTTVISGDVAARLREVKASTDGDIGMSGSATTVRWLLAQRPAGRAGPADAPDRGRLGAAAVRGHPDPATHAAALPGAGHRRPAPEVRARERVLTGDLAAPEPFDLLGPLPTGTTVLEASAGTGKTFTIANLVARYVADGVAMEELLVVSFSRESTRELRERVRERLVSARDGLTEHAVVPDDDRVLRLLTDDCDSAEIGVRRKLFEEALTVFDAATVTTTHGFCQQVLLALGTAGDHDTGAVLVENIADLVAEVADDLYLRKWGVEGAGPPDLGRRCLPRAGDGRGTGPGHRAAARPFD